MNMNEALLLKFKPSFKEEDDFIRRVVFKLERMMFLFGYYSAFGLACGPCRLCPGCNVRGRFCRFPHMARPSIEACGIDVFAQCVMQVLILGL